MKLRGLNFVQERFFFVFFFVLATHSVYRRLLAKFRIPNFFLRGWASAASFIHTLASRFRLLRLCRRCKSRHDSETYSEAMFLSHGKLDLQPQVEEFK